MVSYHLLTLLGFILLPHAHSQTCRDLHRYKLAPEEICEFTHNTTDCHISDGGFINYTQRIYCSFDVNNLFSLGIVIYLFWLLQLLVGQASCVDNFFCPALVSMAKTMHMTDNLAGVTILSFGQAANTVFAAIAGVRNAKGSDFGLPLGALLGEALLITTVVAGLVTFRATPSPFKMVRRPFFRDVGFLMLTVLIVFYIIYDGCITLAKSVGLLFLYIVYAVVVLTGRMVYVSRLNKKERKLARGSSLEKGDTSTTSSLNNCNKVDLGDTTRDSSLESRDTSTTMSLNNCNKVDLGDTTRDSSLESRDTSTTTSLNNCNKVDLGDTATVRVSIPVGVQQIQDSSLESEITSTTTSLNNCNKVDLGDTARDSSLESGANSTTTSLNNCSKVDLGNTTRESSLESGDTSTTASLKNCDKVDLVDTPRDSSLESRANSTTTSLNNCNNVDLGDTASDSSLESGDTSTVTSFNNCNKVDLGDTARDLSLQSGSLEAPEVEDKKPDYGLNGHLSFDNPMQKLLHGLIPIDFEAFREARWYIKAYHVFRSPFRVILLLTIPRVDIEVYNKGWNRYLNVLQVAISPSIVMLLTEGKLTYWGSFPIVIFVFLLSVLCALAVFFTSENKHAPIYHRVFAFYTFAIGVLWINAFSNEIVNIFMTLGVLFNLSSSVLGFTLLAWGNCIGDLIAEPMVAKNGYPQIGYTACFSEPLFFTLMGIGLPFTLTFASASISTVFPITFMLIQVILVAGLLTSLMASLILVPVQRFKVGKAYGGILVLVYVVFLALALLAETGQITWVVTGNNCGRS